jgi:pimeloyl-ACP methyl ester carboxylesterase
MTELWMRSPPATFAYASAALRSRLAATIDRHGWSELADPRRGVAAVAREIQDPRALAESTARVLLVIGEHELPAFRRTAMLLLGACPDATFTVLPSAGHLCMLDAPRDAAGLLRAHWAG